MKSFKQYISEIASLGGIEYEEKVKYSITSVLDQLKGISIKDDVGGAFNKNVVDLYLNIKDVGEVPIEIKQNKDAQMGGPTIQYQLESNDFDLSQKGNDSIDSNTKNLIINTMNQKADDIRRLLKFIKIQDPESYHNKISGLPFTCTKNAWNLAVSKGLLKPINTIIKFNESFIHDWYANKSTFYIQIGGLGLFYLKDNPLDFDVPQFKGNIDIELRAGRSGSKPNIELGEKTVSVTLRAQARFKTSNIKSKYSLDNSQDVITLFQKYSESNND